MDPVDYRPLAAIVAVAIVRLWISCEDRARARPRSRQPVQPWGAGLVGLAPVGTLTRIDWLLALGSLAVLVVMIVMGILTVITK